MKKFNLFWLVMSLCVALMLPVTVLAEETTAADETKLTVFSEEKVAAEAVSAVTTDEYGTICFTNENDLKEIIEMDKADYYSTYDYIGTEPLVITQNIDMTVMSRPIIQLNLQGQNMIIEKDASLKVYEVSNVNALEVNGALECTKLSFLGEDKETLVVKGTLKFDEEISMHYPITLEGFEKIQFVDEFSTFDVSHHITSMEEFHKAIQFANTMNQPQVIHSFLQSVTTIDEPIEIPANVQMAITQATTIKSTVVTHVDSLLLYSNLTVEGKLETHGCIVLKPLGKLTIAEGGSFIGSNKPVGYSDIFISSNSTINLEELLPGLNLDEFEISMNEYSWANTCSLRYIGNAHEHSWTKGSVTAPNCVDQGYTTYHCSCGETNNADFVDPTGIHSYSDDTDTDCNVCGHKRTVELNTISVYRLYNPFTNEHLLTGGVEEKDLLISVGWSLDGVAWEAPVEGIPVYRLYNPYDDWHTYTTSTSERDTMVAAGWTVDGVVSFGYTGKDGRPIYRLFNPYVQTNYHLFTAGAEERDQLVSVGWILEGTAWYAVK